MSKLRMLLNGGLTGLMAISTVFLAVSALLSTYNAIARSFFSFSSPWIEELCCYLCALMMFLMMPRLEYFDDQLSISFLNEKLKNHPAGKKLIFCVRGVITVFLYGILLNAGYSVVVRNLLISSKSPVMKVPYGQLYTVVMITVVLVIIYWVFHFFLKNERGGELNESR
ncbi:MAG: TRAP transporter small permease [Clostridiales Family XIII bacterium]|nr:TRAP transporter small permease [Clostridiales Family XIII bacterium]